MTKTNSDNGRMAQSTHSMKIVPHFPSYDKNIYLLFSSIQTFVGKILKVESQSN